MCGLVSVLLSHRTRTQHEFRAISDLFTKLLVESEHRGPYAIGIALVNSNGGHYIDKAPVPASGFVRNRDYQLVLDRLDQNTTLLMGSGEHPCVIMHNGHISNYAALFRLMKLRREAEVDSEIILRLAEKNLTGSGIDPVGLAEDLALCRGRLSAVIVATSDPTRILLVKGNQPLEVRCHRKRAIIDYASEPEILDTALDKEPGWEEMRIPSWRLVVADMGETSQLVAYPIPKQWDDENERSRPCR